MSVHASTTLTDVATALTHVATTLNDAAATLTSAATALNEAATTLSNASTKLTDSVKLASTLREDSEVPVAPPTCLSASVVKDSTYCTLLELPAEIRNRIYGYTLIQEDIITVADYKPAQPPLLRVNRQIRAEGLAMFYVENTFNIMVDMLTEKTGLPSLCHWIWQRPGRDEYDIIVVGPIPLATLKSWLSLVHRGAVHIKTIKTTRKFSVDLAVERTLDITKGYKGLSWTRTWYQVEGFLRRMSWANMTYREAILRDGL